MKIAIILLGVVVMHAATADEYVNGYVRKDGTYVQGYYRTEPNSQRWDNYSSSGNSNPYTGERGHERNEYSSQPQYNQQDNYREYGGGKSSYQ